MGMFIALLSAQQSFERAEALAPQSSSIGDLLDMRHLDRFCQDVAAPTLMAMALITGATSAHAIVVNIDPNRSSVTYTPGGFIICGPDGNCGSLPNPQTFTLSGSFNVTRETVSYPVWFDPFSAVEREEILFDTLAVDSGDATALGFLFPSYRGVLSGRAFTASEDMCSFFPSMGSCVSLGLFHDYFSGTFDGITLSMTGNDYAGSFFVDTFSFTVVALAAVPTSVPEPGTLACVIAAAAGLGAARGRRRNNAG